MDYSLLLGVHNLDQAKREQQVEGTQAGSGDEKRPLPQKALYSTAMESIQGAAACGEAIDTEDTCVPLTPAHTHTHSHKHTHLKLL